MKAILCILICVFANYGQQTIAPVLLEVATNIHCDDYLARIDNFFIALHNNPKARGYLVISGDKEMLRRKIAYQLWFQGAVNNRRFDPSLVRIIRGEEKGPPAVSFWIVPVGSDFVPQPVTWDFALPSNAKAFVFHDEMEQICGSPGFESVLNEYLVANPTPRTNVVIFAKDQKMYRRSLMEVKKSLRSIARERVRYFYNHVETRYSWAEYWIVP